MAFFANNEPRAQCALHLQTGPSSSNTGRTETCFHVPVSADVLTSSASPEARIHGERGIQQSTGEDESKTVKRRSCCAKQRGGVAAEGGYDAGAQRHGAEPAHKDHNSRHERGTRQLPGAPGSNAHRNFKRATINGSCRVPKSELGRAAC
jgi:hypothetical protein